MLLNPLHGFFQDGKVSVLIDGQYGSTGKGLLAAYVAKNAGTRPKFCVTNASANAGHTTVMGDIKFTTFHLPTASVLIKDSVAYLDAGAIIDPDVLFQELDEHGMWHRVKIHPHAAVILPEHKGSEGLAGSSAGSIGSTQKGVGAALSDKISRKGNVASCHPKLRHLVEEILPSDMAKEGPVFLEVPQGFSLGVNSGGFYPYCTSRDVTVAQAMADAGFHPSYLHKTVMSIRTLPIRVGNIYDGEKLVGWSGPAHADQTEFRWLDLGLKPEFTTVTKRQRRVFSFSISQYQRAIEFNKPDLVFLNFCNYLGKGGTEELVNEIGRAGLRRPDLYGWGPDIKDVEVDYVDFGDDK